MLSRTLLQRAGSAAVAAAILTAGCNRDSHAPLEVTPTTPPPATAVDLEVSAANAAVGDRIAVAVTSENAIGAIQGTLKYDPAKLAYLGYPMEADAATMVNEEDAKAGSIRVGTFSLTEHALPRRAAVVVFEVKGLDYLSALRYEHEQAGTVTAEAVAAAYGATKPVTDLVVPENARHYLLADWQAALGVADQTPISLVPGEVVPGLQYGDCNLNGAPDVNDALLANNTGLGGQMITGTDVTPAPNGADLTVACNPEPRNTVGGVIDPDNLPGNNPGGTRTIDVNDALSINRGSLGLAPNNQVVGVVITGRSLDPFGACTGLTGFPGGSLSVVADTTFIAVGTVVTGDATIPAGCLVVLRGVLTIGDDRGPDAAASLTIEEGVRIEGDQATADRTAIFIMRDATIDAQGTELEPIVMTCTAGAGRSPGCWGGIFIAGNSSINETTQATTSPAVSRADGLVIAGGCAEERGEGDAPFYGGCGPTGNPRGDDSGILRYVRVEFAGDVLVAGDELNGFTFGAIGNGTTLEFLQAHAGADDGFEFFGGHANMRFFMATAVTDDSWDGTKGYDGFAQYGILHQTDASERGLEMDNTDADCPACTNNPRTNPVGWNITIVRSGAVPAGAEGLLLRKGHGGTYRNFLVVNTALGFEIDDAQSCQGSALNDRPAPGAGVAGDAGFAGPWSMITNSVFQDVGGFDNGPCGFSQSPPAQGNINVMAVAQMGSPQNVNGAADYRPLLGTAAATAANAWVGGVDNPACLNEGCLDLQDDVTGRNSNANAVGVLELAPFVGGVPPRTSTNFNDVSPNWYLNWTRPVAGP